MNNKQKLGIKVFYYYLSKRISVGIAILVVSIISTSFKEILILKLATLVPLQASTDVVTFTVKGLFVVSFLFLVFGSFISFIKYISCDFTMDENAFNIRRGFLTKREVSIPYRQIQNINIEQSLGNKMLGIGKLVILTEGDHGENNMGNREGVFDVIDYDLAHEVREFILQRTNMQTVKDISQ